MDPESTSIIKLRGELNSIEKGSIILLHLNPREYFDLTLEALKCIITEKEASVTYVTASRPYNYLVSAMESKNIRKENLLFINCITYMANILPEKDGNCVFIENPSSLEEISMHIEDLLEKLGARDRVLFVDSLSTFLMYNNMKTLKEFSHFLINKLRINGVGGLFIVIKGASRESITDELAMMFDKVIEI